MYRLLIFSSFLAMAMAAVAIQEGSVGQKVVINFEAGTKRLVRKDGGVKAFLEACEETDTRRECTEWKTAEGEFLSGGVRLLPNGDLVIEKISDADFAFYSNPDDEGRKTKHADGTISAVLGLSVALVQA